LNATENLFSGRWPEKRKGWVDWGTLAAESANILRRMGVSLDTAVLVPSLSVTQRQMIEIARALSFHAKIIVMDEPTSSLTEKETARLFQLIRELKCQGVTIIYISHRLDGLFEIADRIRVMKDGIVTGVCEVKGVTKARLIRLMVGRDIQDL
jgi:ribose transport system ATP-binding protein